MTRKAEREALHLQPRLARMTSKPRVRRRKDSLLWASEDADPLRHLVADPQNPER